MKRVGLAFALALVTALTAWAWQSRPRATPPTLAGMVPQGALLTIESPDFATLLASWNTSPQARAWLASDNYKVFSNSRLFSRLSDAQDQFIATAFAATAKTPESSTLLTQVAGKQSIFAWYNVGNLEFLYVTHLASAHQLQSALLQQRSHFQQRQSAGLTFYIRTSKDLPARTVAFATVPDPTGHGDDLLLLATREDLLAQSLALIAAPGQGMPSEPWYAEATAAVAPSQQAPVLHMVLNLERLVPMPYFRSYWVQQNLTEMAQYRTAVADLYRAPGAFREERVLLAKSAPESTPALDLNLLAALAPPEGVFRATATQDPTLAVAALEEKLLGRQQAASTVAEAAPEAALDPTSAGTGTDLETRIDTPEPVSATYSSQALTDALKSARFDGLLTYSTALAPTADAALWVPIHNGVVLSSTTSWDAAKLQSAVQQSLRGSLTTGTLGIDFHPAGNDTFALTGPRPLYLAVRGNLAYLADDAALLQSLLSRQPPTPVQTLNTTVIAGFSHTAQRAPYTRLTSLIDATNAPSTADHPAGNTPAYFSQNLRSLSDSFAALQSERFTQTTQGQTIHQTVLYQWH